MAGAVVVGGGGRGGGGGGAVSFPLVFFDGECETGIGNVAIHPFMDFVALQSILSRKIGISPHQFTVYIAKRSDAARGRVPVTGKFDFSAVCREEDCFFLVALKRSRRVRTRKGKKEETSPSPPPAAAVRKEPPPNAMLLRRGGGGGELFTGLDEFEKRVRQLQREKERYLANLGTANLRIERESKSFGCKECERDVGFHWCVNDAVTFGFRSFAGPIARPGKGPG